MLPKKSTPAKEVLVSYLLGEFDDFSIKQG